VSVLRHTPPLRCPVCLDPLTVILEYVTGSYSEHRDHKGYECDNFRCDARWDQWGNVTQPSKLVDEDADSDAATTVAGSTTDESRAGNSPSAQEGST
jgi:hypothetical protein